MSSESSASVSLNRKRVHRDPSVTLAYASGHRLDASVPVGVPLAGPSDRRSSDALSPEAELPDHRPEVVPSQETGPTISRSVLKDSTEEGSLYARLETSSGRSEPSERVETNESTSGGDKGSFMNFQNAAPKSLGPGLGHGIKLDDSNDVASTMSSSLVYALRPAGEWEDISIIYPQTNDQPWSLPSGYMCVYECFIKNGGLRFPIPRLLLQYCHRRRDDFSPSDPDVRFAMSAISMFASYNFLSDAWYASDQKNRKLNTQIGELVAELNRSLEARRNAELEVDALTSALAEAEEIKRKEVSRVEGEVAELNSSSKDAVDGMDQLELQGGDAEDDTKPAGTKDPAATEEPGATEAVDATTGEAIAPLFSLPDSTPEEQVAAP
ncbi:hypothetical protein AALP_AA2G051300 [Arabis alpina]|uniref:Uncharacterized protein n=1 Tax=Arabis alpina TaxID=50452 RepID=A0A087HFG0_ARAAL|nr:hypothetical protein AALP_AA2G051300 [Arabis alpina]